MSTDGKGGGDRTLQRIIALLVSLASLAERVAAYPYPVRFLVLWLLRRAEAIAGDFVFDETGVPPQASEIGAVGNDPADALFLAARLLTLAAALGVLVDSAFGPEARHAGPARACREIALHPGSPSGGWTPEPIDTS